MTRSAGRAPALLRLLAGLVLGGLLLAGCAGGEDDPQRPPQEVLAAAKATLDETSGVHVVLSTEELPDGVSGIVKADGVGTHAPAFEGTLKVVAGGISADAEVIAVGDEVYAKLPFTTDFTPITPADYGAPDPADLMATEGGLSSLLTAARDVTRGEPVREGERVLTEYTGTVPGDAVARVIPTASADSSFDATFTVSEDDVLDQAVLTGPFYAEGGDVTYTIEFDRYGLQKEITAP